MIATFAALLITLIAQFPVALPKLPSLPIPVPGVPSLPQSVPIPPILREPPPITTTASDAFAQVPALDDFTPADPASLSWLPRDADGAFALLPGAYAWTVQSFCLNAGAHAPGTDAAYLLAPLRGSRATVVASVVQRAGQHPEISQEAVQMLLWTITSRGRIASTSAPVRAAADVLMTSAERQSVDGGVIGAIPPAVRDALLANAPPAARQAFDTVAQVRDLLENGNSSYAQIAAIAAPRAAAHNGAVPRNRWAFAPSGYFLRLSSDGYQRVQIEVYVPEGWVVQRDSAHRIATVSAPNGRRIDIAYSGDRARVQMVAPFAQDLSGRRRAATSLPVTWASGDDGSALHALETAVADSAPASGWTEAQRSAAADALGRAHADTVYRGLTHAAALAPRQVAFAGGALVALGSRGGAAFSPSSGVGAPSDAGLQPLAVSVRDGGNGVPPPFIPQGCDPVSSPLDHLPPWCTPRPPDKDRTCRRAREQLAEAIEWLNFYQDPKYLDYANANGFTGNQYEDLVTRAIQNFDTTGSSDNPGTTPSGGIPQAWDQADTSPVTCLTTFPAAFYAQPAIIQLAIRAHEGGHAARCRSLKAKGVAPVDTPADAQADEIGAYTAEIKFLEAWIAAHCSA